jgi:MerR family mercuric resistance operon transcriptional regulator
LAQISFTIGALAKTAGVNVETIRFYQRRGLLTEPERPLNGVRRYTERDAQRVRFIKQGQKLGFSLDELTDLLRLEDGQHCREARDIALKKLAAIRERIEGLRAMEETLADLAERCAQNTEAVSCPVILALLGPSQP